MPAGGVPASSDAMRIVGLDDSKQNPSSAKAIAINRLHNLNLVGFVSDADSAELERLVDAIALPNLSIALNGIGTDGNGDTQFLNALRRLKIQSPISATPTSASSK